MGIFDKIIGKKGEKKPAVEKEVAETARKEKEPEKKPKPKKRTVKKPARNAARSAAGGEAKARKVAKKDENIAHEILLESLVTEKSTSLAQFNKYVFKVSQKASKGQIRNAVQDFYGVGVTGVNIIKIHPKKRIHGRTVGYKKGYKKAVVTLQAGDTIGVSDGV